MSKEVDLGKDNETIFEEHFCHQLELHGNYRLNKNKNVTINKDLCLYFDDLEEFLRSTQQDNLKKFNYNLIQNGRKSFKITLDKSLQEAFISSFTGWY